jgi:ABC-type antimicrobial peptide transport system permease subunit
MKILLNNHFENAFEALHANRLRTFLTILGAVIGTASITTVLSIASGATGFFEKQIADTHDSIALIRPNTELDTSMLIANARTLPPASTLTEEDVRDIERIPNVMTAPMSVLHTGLIAKDGAVDRQHATLVGSTVGLLSVAKLELLDGQFFEDNVSTSGVVMGKQLAIDIFGTEHALGNVVKIRGETFTVMGVLKESDQPINYMGVDFDHAAIITTTAMKRFTQKVLQIQQIVLQAEDPTLLETATESAKEILTKNHAGEQDFAVLTGTQLVASDNELFTGLTRIVAIIASISLLVGGIGIMNIMLVNVAERNREVGIRKAIGAANGQIINQFLIESTIIGLTGGVIGYGLGVGVAFLIGVYLPFLPMIEWQVAVLSIGVATGTGILFGLYPAIRAAKKDPITALRQ